MFHVNFPLHALPDAPTIKAGTARMAEFDRLTMDEGAELARMLREIGDMSEEEAEGTLSFRRTKRSRKMDCPSRF